MQPLHCDLQPEIQETHRTTHTWTTTRCKTPEEEPIRAWFGRSRTRRTREVPFIAGRSHFTRKNTRFPAPAFPQNEAHVTWIHAAITMRFATSSSQPASLDAHGKTKPQRSCSHYTAICNQRFKKRIELRTHEQPLVAEHRGGTDSRPVRPQPHPPHTRGTFHRRPEPLYTEKHKVSYPGLQHPCSHYNAFCNFKFPTRISRRTWQDKTTTIMQPLHCDLQLQSQETHRTTHTWTTTRCKTQRRNRFALGSTAAAPAAHARYLSSPAPAPAFPQNEAHATSMQPYNAFCNFRFQCKVTHHPSLSIVSVMYSHTPPFIECSLRLLIVMWCKVTHHPSLNVVSHVSLLCDAKSHTTLLD